MVEFIENFKAQVYQAVDTDYLEAWYDKFYKYNIDYSKLKDEAYIKETLHIVKWTFKGLFMGIQKEKGNILDDTDIIELMKTCDHYYKVLVANFYG